MSSCNHVTPALGDTEIYSTEYLAEHGAPGCCDASCCESRPLLDKGPEPASEPKVLGAGDYPRLIARDGESNVVHRDETSRRFCSNMSFIFHVLISLPLWKLVVLFFLSYIVVFMLSGLVIEIHRRFHPETYFGINRYFDAVIFMGYTITTVGFGNQYPNASESSFFPLVMVCWGLLMDAFWLGLILARISSARPLRHTLLFSKVAVLHDDVFECRLINLRQKYPWVDCTIKLCLSSFNHSANNIEMVSLEIDDHSCKPFLDLPWIVKHPLSDDSPLRKMLREGKFASSRGEIIVEVNGQDPLTGNCMLKRFSYVADEIREDHVFVNVLSVEPEVDGESQYAANLVQFHDTMSSLAKSGPIVLGGYGTATTTEGDSVTLPEDIGLHAESPEKAEALEKKDLQNAN